MRRAGGRCEWCQAVNYEPHPVTGSKVILTTAHLGEPFARNADKHDKRDIRAVKRWVSHAKAVVIEGEALVEFIEQGFQIAREWGVRLWGVQFNWDKGIYRESAPFSTLSFLTASWHGFAGCPLKYDEALPLKEDYDLTLQELNAWRRLLRFNFVHVIKDDHENRGGCAAMRNVAVEIEQMAAFRRKWGSGIVRSDQGKSREKTRRRDQAIDINPIIKVPISGV